ncbi:MAG: hypothetical protein A4E35_02432 [Methanoregula sp. PtaU1.Bin051]|nr:MAG: hypothetical protein A4E35_02432 [Methanoregula sp. PtaU1.Bin051]
MNILFIQREGTDLHHTLFASETSRLALRFYHPKKMPCGVYVSVSTLGSALSLVSELKWYIRRYVREVLFEIERGIFCTHQLAQDVYYERAVVLGASWKFRRLYGFRNGQMVSAVVMTPGSVIEDYRRDVIGADTAIEVWCREDEVEDIALEDQEPEESAGLKPGELES